MNVSLQNLHTDGWRFRCDLWLLIAYLILMATSLLLLYDPMNESPYLQRQIINYVVALVVFLTVSQFPSNFLRLISPYCYAIGVILLLLVLVIGVQAKGAQRWLSLGGFNIQPSEFFKIVLPMMLAWWFSQADEGAFAKKYTWLVAFFIVATPTLLIMVQPDLGSALMVLMGAMIMIFLAGLSWYVIMGGVVAAIASVPILWMSMHAYQKQRVLTFLSPETDPLGSGYHIIQSKIAIGSGGLLGHGWNQGSQALLDFLPEQHTDFIFSVFAEEYGLVGSSILILLFFILMMRSIYVARHAESHFLRLFTATLGIMLFIYTFVNMAMVMGLLPVVGLPLPFISYGGSSLITYAIILGVLSSVGHQRELT